MWFLIIITPLILFSCFAGLRATPRPFYCHEKSPWNMKGLQWNFASEKLDLHHLSFMEQLMVELQASFFFSFSPYLQLSSFLRGQQKFDKHDLEDFFKFSGVLLMSDAKKSISYEYLIRNIPENERETGLSSIMLTYGQILSTYLLKSKSSRMPFYIKV